MRLLSCSPASKLHPSCHTSFICVLLIWVLAVSFTAVAAPGDRLGAPLTQALRESATPDTTLPVWVYFTPRDLTPTQRDLALDQAARKLNADTARRRSKVRASGERLVDEGDLPLDPRHLERAEATGARLRHRSRWLGAASFAATPEQIHALAALDCVRRVDLVWKMLEPAPAPTSDAPRAATEPSRDWTLDYGLSLATLELINVPPVHELGYTGAGVKLAFLDSGFRLTHEAMDHVPVLAAYDIPEDDSVVDWETGDDEGIHTHGTQVASAALAYAPGQLVGPAYGASTILAKIDGLDTSIEGLEDWWVAGLEWVEAQGADLVSSSYGYYNDYALEELDGNTAASTIAADQAVARGLPVFNAAGNFGISPETNLIVAPADGDSVVAVGATDVAGNFAIWSSYGPTPDGRIKPDIAAQGEQVNVIDPYLDTAYAQTGGTSLSTPLASAVASLVLERAPFLTPMQLREALLQTASISDEPDNQLGWGVLDALAAVHYWGPKFQHEHLPNTEISTEPYVVNAVCSDQFTLTPGWPRLYHRTDGGPWQEIVMSDRGRGNYRGEIPAQPVDSTVEYYLSAQDDQGLVAHYPPLGAAEPCAFEVALDSVPPVLVHEPLNDQLLSSWPPAVVASATDNIDMAQVTLSYSVNGGAASEPVRLTMGVDDLYAALLPIPAGDLQAGDTVSYTLTATDASLGMNTSESGPHSFQVLAGPGQILLLYAGYGSLESTAVAGWIEDAGFSVTTMNAINANAAHFTGKQAVVYVAGMEPDPLPNSTVRLNLENWVAGGGRLILESGEVGYVATIYSSHAGFLANVLHSTGWAGDEAGDLVTAAGQDDHPLLNDPLPITPPLELNYFAPADQDAMRPASDAYLVLQNNEPGALSGVIVHDGNPLDPAGQIVYLPFALSALNDQNAARALVVNSLAHLLDNSLPAPVDDEADGGLPQVTRLLGGVPNPFNAQTTVRFELAEAGSARIEIFDLRGRLVRCLSEGSTRLAPGSHDIHWDGRSDAGRNVSSGVYFVRLNAGGVLSRAKIALVK